jgi:hypothetical protein
MGPPTQILLAPIADATFPFLSQRTELINAACASVLQRKMKIFFLLILACQARMAQSQSASIHFQNFVLCGEMSHFEALSAVRAASGNVRMQVRDTYFLVNILLCSIFWHLHPEGCRSEGHWVTAVLECKSARN